MSTLRSGLDELRAVDLRHLSDTELEDRLSELRRASGVIDAESARTLAEVERRGSYADSGHLSITSWVEHRFQASWSEAANKVRAARALEAMPEVREALYDGEVSPSVVGQLVAAHEASPEEFSKVEATLVDAEAAARADSERYDRRGLHVSPTLEGMVRVDGNLDPETGQTLITALRSVTDASARDGSEDPRTPAQRRCDALGEIARQHLDRSDRPVVGGERPHLTVVLDLEALEGRAGRRCDLDEAGTISPESARRIACDASVTRVHPSPLGAPRRGGGRPRWSRPHSGGPWW